MTTHRTWKGRVFIGVTLDGKIARLDGDIDWLTDQPVGRNHTPGHQGPAAPAGYDDFMAATDHVVMGRATYEKVLTFGGQPYKGKQVVVLSTTLSDEEAENVTVARTLDEVCELLSSQDASGVYIDGGQVIQSSLREGLIDEITIGVAPVLIGAGIPLFGDIPEDILLTHVGTSYDDSGMTSTRYLVNHSMQGASRWSPYAEPSGLAHGGGYPSSDASGVTQA